MTLARWQRRFYPCEWQRNFVRRFAERVEQSTRPDMRALEIGAGAGIINPHRVRDHVRHLVGLDLSQEVGHNPLIEHGLVADIVQTPFQAASFDLAFATYVLEHIADPSGMCRELRRIIRPGGHFMALTPNIYHYVAAVSRLTPHSFHEWFNQTSTRGTAGEDVFPTYYRLNSRSSLRMHLSRAGFTDIRLEMVEAQPNYLLWNTPAFLAGTAYERLVNSSNLFSGIRVNILVTARAA